MVRNPANTNIKLRNHASVRDAPGQDYEGILIAVTGSLQFDIVRDTTSPEFAAAMAIYLGAFPAAERHPVETIRQRVADGRSQLHIARSADQVAFMALLWPLADTDFILLDYLATAPRFRGGGIATRFMEDMRARMTTQGKNLVMEVEDPASGDNSEERRRRFELYRHMGARRLEGVQYLLPPLQGSKPTDMILMLFPGLPRNVLGGDQVRHLITRIYAELYGRGADDPLLERPLAQIQPRIELV